MADKKNYKKITKEVQIPFTYRGVFYDTKFKGTKEDIAYLKQYLKQ